MYLSSKIDFFKDAEFNVRTESEDDKTTSSYKGPLYCRGAYDALSEMGRKSANLFAQGVEGKWRLIVQRTHACGAMLQFYNQHFDIIVLLGACTHLSLSLTSPSLLLLYVPLVAVQ